MEKIEAFDRAGRWFVSRRRGAAERGAGAARECGIMLYVPFLFVVCSNGAGGYIPAVGIWAAAAGAVACCN